MVAVDYNVKSEFKSGGGGWIGGPNAMQQSPETHKMVVGAQCAPDATNLGVYGRAIGSVGRAFRGE